MRRKTAKTISPRMLYYYYISKIDHACRGSKRVLSRFKQKWVKCAHHKKIGPTMPWKNFSRDRHPNPNSNPKRKVTEYLKNICGEKATCTCFPSVSCMYCPIWCAPPLLAFRLVRTKQPFEPSLCPKAHRPDKGEPPSWPSQRIPYRPIWICLVLYGQNHGERRAHRS